MNIYQFKWDGGSTYWVFAPTIKEFLNYEN